MSTSRRRKAPKLPSREEAVVESALVLVDMLLSTYPPHLVALLFAQRLRNFLPHAEEIGGGKAMDAFALGADSIQQGGEFLRRGERAVQQAAEAMQKKGKKP